MPLGNLQRLVGGRQQAAQAEPVECHQQAHRGRAGRGGHPRALFAEQLQAAVVEAADYHPVELPVRLQGRAQLRLHADIRHLDLYHLGLLGEAFEHLGEGRDAHALAAIGIALATVGAPAVARIQRLQLRAAERGDRALAIGGAVQLAVVDHHQLAVAGQAQVHLQHVHAQVAGALEGQQAVLRPQPPAAAMGDDQGLFAEGGEHRRLAGRAAGLGQGQQGDGKQCEGHQQKAGEAQHGGFHRGKGGLLGAPTMPKQAAPGEG